MFIRFCCYLIFRLWGWEFKNEIKEKIGPAIMIGYPHTTNWDFVPVMSMIRLGKFNAKFVIKQEWLFPPLSWIFKSMGAVGVDRKKIASGEVSDTIGLMANLFKEHEDLVLMISPEGTRKKVEKWKSGFHRIAVQAGVPICCAYANYEKKEIGIGLKIMPSDFDEDMKKITEYYAKVGHGKRHELASLDNRYNK
jgi:1-acyl-sn-glycerol-3-phosphate acyltransferase